MTVELNIINEEIANLTKQRDNLLRELRKKCNHLRLIELDANPPRRICFDCGAEENGWYCGYHVLVMNGDIRLNVPHKEERALIAQTSDTFTFYRYRKGGPLYFVGQSHPNFTGGGIKSYQQLTEVSA